ncbi:MAG: hypothetical protein JJE29_01170 [Peptostreptococcaceae bacterium]|nr:hypothetical protein [Peptostreptococcaceae bacterium]
MDLDLEAGDRFYHVKISFDEDSQLENVRTFSIVNGIM